MSIDDYQAIQARIVLFAKLAINFSELEKHIEAQNRADSIGWIYDPTLYRDKVSDLRCDMDFAQSLLEYQAKVRALCAKHKIVLPEAS